MVKTPSEAVPKAPSQSPSLFVFSSGRSGTTLLVSILNASQQIHIPAESDFLARAFSHYQFKQRFETEDYQEAVRIFKSSSQHQGWNLDTNYLLSYLEARRPQSFADLISTISEAYHASEGTQDLMWGIKAPVLIASLDRIQTVFPDAKLIHIVRDGRDVYLSYNKIHARSEVSGQPKFGPKGVWTNALYWVDGLRRVEAEQAGVKETEADLPNRIYELRYEDLLTAPQTTLENLCQFLGVPYTPMMHENFASVERNQKLIKNDFLQTIHAKLGGKLDATNIHKYRQQMSRRDRLIFELLTLPYLKKYGYDVEFPWLKLPVFAAFRASAYWGARQINDRRYRRRDQQFVASAATEP
jgi:Sulfotransferase family